MERVVQMQEEMLREVIIQKKGQLEGKILHLYYDLTDIGKGGRMVDCSTGN